MDRLFTEGIAIDQAARVRPVIRIVLDDFPLQHTEEDLLVRETIGPTFLVRVIRNPDPVPTNRLNDELDLHSPGLPQFSSPDSSPTRTSRFWRMRAVKPQIWRLPMW